MASTSSADLVRVGRSLVVFNRFRPARYYAIDLAIFGGPLVLAAPEAVASLTTVLALASMHLARLGGLILDDYADREADAVEAPHRPIPRRLVTPREALGLGLGALGAGLVTAALVGPVFLTVLVAAYVLLFASFGIANDLDVPVVPTAATVTSVSMLSLLGWVAHGDLSLAAVAVFGATWCWDWAHDALGAARDREGDAAADIATVATVASPVAIGALSVAGLLAAYGLLVGLLATWLLTPVLAGWVAGLLTVPLALALNDVVGYVRGRVGAGDARRTVEWFVIAAYGVAVVAALLVAVG